jgi:putative flippase GtrA
LPQSVRRLSKFASVGVVNTSIDFAVFSALLWGGLNPTVAHVLGYLAGLSNSFLLNWKWTFRDRKTHFSWGTVVRFFLSNFFTQGITTATVSFSQFRMQSWNAP